MTVSPAVWEVTSDGKGGGSSRLVHEAGSPEAEAFHAKYGDPENPVALEAAGDIAQITCAEAGCPGCSWVHRKRA